MKNEAEPITDDEWLLRRVRLERFRTDSVPIISPNSFEPRLPGPKVRDPDLTGISLYRQSCLANVEEILATVPAEKRHEFGIVALPALLFRELDLTIRPEHDQTVPGHVVIPELRAEAYAASKAAFTPIKLRLAEVASQHVLRWPTDAKPDSANAPAPV